MKKVYVASLVTVLAFFSIVLTSAVPTSTTPTNHSVVRAKNALAAYEKATVDGKINRVELKEIATAIKGRKLTFKEKIGIKLFGKKMLKKLNSAELRSQSPASSGYKSQLTAALLCFFLGGLGVHRFYLGYTWIGVIQLITLGGCGIWALIDFIRILTGNLTPKDGDYDSTFN